MNLSEATEHPQNEAVGPHWQIFPAALFGVCGLLLVLASLFSIFMLANNYQTDPPRNLYGTLLMGCGGLCWSYTGYLCWTNRFRPAVLGSIIGYLFSMLGSFINEVF